MLFDEWEPTYNDIMYDFGFNKYDDEVSVRTLKAVTLNANLILDDDLHNIIMPEVTVFGDSSNLEDDVSKLTPVGTFIAAGSATKRMLEMGFKPDIIVTDLDGDIQSQAKANNNGAIALLHAHGDNADLIRQYAHLFKGQIILTTQSKPDRTVYNYGGFTDGDRAVCLARSFGARKIHLVGFDFENPNLKKGSDPEMKKKKLKWAKKIIFDMNDPSVEIITPSNLAP